MFDVRSHSWDKTSLISFGCQMSDMENCGPRVIRATIDSVKQLLASLNLIAANQSSGISVEYTYTTKGRCRIVFRFYSPSDLSKIDRNAEFLQMIMTSILQYFRTVMKNDLKLRSMEKDLMLNINRIEKKLDSYFNETPSKEKLEKNLSVILTNSLAFSRNVKRPQVLSYVK